MAAQAKVVISYDRPDWREAGQSGNAFVTHEQAVIGEIFDACDSTATKAALGGFLALSPELRQSFAAGLPMLMGSQMVQVFGAALEHGEQHYQDWATEPYTCSAPRPQFAPGRALRVFQSAAASGAVERESSTSAARKRRPMGPAISKAHLTRRDASIVRCAAPPRPR